MGRKKNFWDLLGRSLKFESSTVICSADWFKEDFNMTGEYVSFFQGVRRSNGRRLWFYKAPEKSRYYIYFTPLFACEICGKMSTPKKIQPRPYLIFLHKSGSAEPSKALCMGCCNKLKTISKIHNEIILNGKLINKLKREVANVRKNQHNRGIERLSGKDDVGGQRQRVEP